MRRPFPVRIGILGGGQLARMLVQKGHDLGFEMKVLCASPSEPAAQATSHVRLGDPNRAEDVAAFARTVDVLALESEFHSGVMLAEALKDSPAPLYPRPLLIQELQDRLPQKQLLEKHGLPTADFIAVSSSEDLAFARKRFKDRFVLKKRTGGYDGYGTIVVRGPKDIAAAERVEFRRTPFIAESFVPFKRELAVQVARAPGGPAVFFPLVETKQVDHRLDWLRGPIPHRKFPALQKKLSTFVRRVDYVGVIAFELFDTGRELLVNEIAPRVHNSGHATIEALSVDQFTQHLRAIAGLKLTTPELQAPAFALTNLIGAGRERPEFPAALSSHLHWYGKIESRPGRKMGHLTAIGPSAAKCLARVLKDRKGFRL